MSTRGGDDRGCDFQLGEVVVCVDAAALRSPAGPTVHRCPLVEGRPYTIVAIIPANPGPMGPWRDACLLREARNTKSAHGGFGTYRFRRVTKNPDAFLTSCLKAAHEPSFERKPEKVPVHSDSPAGGA